MLRTFALATATLLLLCSCGTVPLACPAPPPLPVLGPTGPDFQDRMRDFLSGKLPEPTGYELTSKPAAAGLKPSR